MILKRRTLTSILLSSFLIILLLFYFICFYDGISFFTDTKNIYAHAKARMFSNAVRNALPRVYVPNSLDNTVSVIDPSTYKVIDTFSTGKEPQHIVPAYDLSVLWVLNNSGNSLTPINPATAKPETTVPVTDPYNLYFTPDGKFAIVVSEGHHQLVFSDPHTMAAHDAIHVECSGVNHMDFTANGRYAFATCEYSGQLLKLDVFNHKIIAYLKLMPIIQGRSSMPQDIRFSPDGNTLYVADMMMNGVYLIDPVTFTEKKFIATGVGAHGIYPSRNGKYLYVTNRGCDSRVCHSHGQGSIAVIDPVNQIVVSTWPIPGGGSPDMGNVSADGKELWVAGRYDSEVYVFDTETGTLTHRIPVGRGPHGLTVWPQPGRYSLGHTGNMR